MDESTLLHCVIDAIAAWSIGSAEDVARNAIEPKDAKFTRAHAALIDQLAKEMEELIMIGWAIRYRDQLIEKLPPSTVPQDYIDGTQNQEGYTYWITFKDPEDLLNDVRLYKDNTEG